MTLIGYWPLNEDSGDTAYDHSGNENHGTINDGNDSTVLGADGPLGQNAYSFDGSSDNTDIEDVIDNRSALTISCWVKREESTTGKLDSDEGVVASGYNGTDAGFEIGINNSPEAGFHAAVYDDGDWIESRTSVINNEWVHLIGIFDEGEITLFVNATQKSRVNSSRWNKTPDINTPAKIGARYQDGEIYSFPGKISEVRIYDRPLTKSEVQYLYNVGQRGLQTTSKKSS